MHPEPWPTAQHLPVIALAIVLCAALIGMSLIATRLRLGQVREADTRQAQVDHLANRGLSHAVRLTSVEASVTASSAAITSLTARAAEIEARLDMLRASIDEQRTGAPRD